jgi:hypothetical protein
MVLLVESGSGSTERISQQQKSKARSGTIQNNVVNVERTAHRNQLSKFQADECRHNSYYENLVPRLLFKQYRQEKTQRSKTYEIARQVDSVTCYVLSEENRAYLLDYPSKRDKIETVSNVCNPMLPSQTANQHIMATVIVWENKQKKYCQHV